MSGVATTTRKVVDIVGDEVLIAPTRKTLWGWLDKRAVMLGGGGTHRLNLNDAVIVKDNHLALLDGNLAEVVERLERSTADCRFVEIEVDNVGDAVTLAAKLSDSTINAARVVMFDNMNPTEIEDALTQIKMRDHYKNLLFEASGGVDMDNVATYAKTGVDIISMGCLTTGAKSLDMSFAVEK
jgi:nicotinate-nucleotide pyrophosphorylase (carboxylating)